MDIEPDVEIECIACEEVVHCDTMDDDGRCEACQERTHERQERTYG